MLCPAGWYTPVAGPFLHCLPCMDGSYAEGMGGSGCSECPAGRSTERNATASRLGCRCLPGRFLPLKERTWEASGGLGELQACMACPMGASCEGHLAGPVAEPGWWLLPSEVPVKCTMQGDPEAVVLDFNQIQMGFKWDFNRGF